MQHLINLKSIRVSNTQSPHAHKLSVASTSYVCTAQPVAVYILSGRGLASSAAIYQAHDDPDEDPPRAEEGDDAVEEVVGRVIVHDRCVADLPSEAGGSEGGGGRGREGEGKRREGDREERREERRGEKWWCACEANAAFTLASTRVGSGSAQQAQPCRAEHGSVRPWQFTLALNPGHPG